VVKVLEVALILLIPTLVGAGLIYGVRLWSVAARRIRNRRAVAAGSPVPLERLAANLRRLHGQVNRVEDAADMKPGRGVRVKALRTAYGDSLLAACRALEVPDPPTDPTRLTTSEIYRLESALRDRGLDVRPSALH
jgi:hypothetical protein